jgi:potassium large conductance calcium-activated channel subfamily M alpha protein 1
MFYWCPTQTVEQQTIVKLILYLKFLINFYFKDIRVKCELTHHVICCVFAEESSPVIGLRSFVMPLRASNFDENELKSIVFIGNSVFLRKEWRHICNFPKVYLVDVCYILFYFNKNIYIYYKGFTK